MLTIALCEDNPIHQKQILNLIHTHIQEQYIIDTFQSSGEFRKTLSSAFRSYDLIFMDIELGTDSGIKLSKEINQMLPQAEIIFVSQYIHYASDVYEIDHTYFIEKKNLSKYVPKALEKALTNIQELNNRHLSFSWNREKFELLQKDILYMERMLRTTEIHTRHQTFQTSEKLADLIKRLDSCFVTCHRSYIINLQAVSHIDKSYITLTTQKKIPVSRSHYDTVKKTFNTLI